MERGEAVSRSRTGEGEGGEGGREGEREREEREEKRCFVSNAREMGELQKAMADKQRPLQ